jgi:hypothetical protein
MVVKAGSVRFVSHLLVDSNPALKGIASPKPPRATIVTRRGLRDFMVIRFLGTRKGDGRERVVGAGK